MRRSSVFPWTYLESLVAGWRGRAEFTDVRCFALFIGQPRSGTSLVGSLLNAHRHLCIAQELNALRYVARGYNRDQLFWLLKVRDQQFGDEGRNWTGYDYTVPGQWQGRHERLLVIGDKKAGVSSEILGRSPQLLTYLQKLVKVPVRVYHVIRNPFNVITTIHRKRRRTSLSQAVSMYFTRCATNWQLMQDPRCPVLSFRLEALIADPQRWLNAMCEFVDVTADDDYVDACRSVLFAQPRQSQREAAWPSDLVDMVYRQMEAFPFLNGYEFESSELTPRRFGIQAA